MEHHNEGKTWGIICGIGGGMTQWFLQANVDTAFMVKLMQAGITALVCGLLGALGKYLFDVVLKPLFLTVTTKLFKRK